MPYGAIAKTRQLFAEVGEGVQLVSSHYTGLIATRKGRVRRRFFRPSATVKGTKQFSGEEGTKYDAGIVARIEEKYFTRSLDDLDIITANDEGLIKARFLMENRS